MRIPRPLLIGTAALAAVLAGVLVGLDRSGPAAAPPQGGQAAVPAEVQRGQEMYSRYCANCHGAEGKGDGISGRGLPIRPQDLTDGRVLNPLPDHFLFKVIQQGGQAVGLSPLMPGFTPTLGDRQIREVLAYVRTLAQPPFDPKGVLPVPVTRQGPVQPILFSHVIHAGSFGIACQYCHAGARRTSAAGLPSVERCMGCHKIVASQGNPEVDKLRGYWERKEPIPWVRVFKVPEHARFTHKPHVRAGLQCQTCHGRVEALEQVAARTGQNLTNDLLNLAGVPAQSPLLSMGWCVECHRIANDRGVQAVQKASDAPIPSVAVPAVSEARRLKAPLECVNCHH